MKKLVQYIKNRLQEKSTWAAIGVGVTGAAALAPPWSYVFITVAVIGVLVPTTPAQKECGNDETSQPD